MRLRNINLSIRSLSELESIFGANLELILFRGEDVNIGFGDNLKQIKQDYNSKKKSQYGEKCFLAKNLRQLQFRFSRMLGRNKMITLINALDDFDLRHFISYYYILWCTEWSCYCVCL